MVWTQPLDQLVDHSGKYVEHRPEWRIHERDDWSATAKIFLPFCQNVAGWQLSTMSYRPRIGFSVTL